MPKQVPLSRGLFALVDDEDYELVQSFTWVAGPGGKTFYASSAGVGLLHRFLLGPKAGQEIDHINGDGLDNRRSNLRKCTHKENQRNKRKQEATSSRFKGVSSTRSGAWRVAIEQNGVQIKLGSFNSEIRAARQYDRAARLFFGAFARTNETLGLYDGAEDRVIARRKVGRPSKRQAA